MSPSHPSLRTKLLYGFGSVAYGVKDNGFSFLLLLYYNQVLGLPERWVGAGIMLALVLDAVSDPIVGYVSDHLHSRWGRRHPFMYASAVPVMIAYFLLWNPPAGLSPPQLFAYFVVIAVLVRTFITFYEIPSSALAAELTDQYDERTSLLGFRFFFGWWGGLTMAVLAFAVFLQPDAAHPVGVLNPAGYHRYGVAASLLMAFSILVSTLGTHAAIPYLREPPVRRSRGLAAVLGDMRETLSNRSFLAIFGAGIFSAMGAGIIAALNIYLNTFFWELDSNQMSLLVVGNFVSAALALPLASRLSGLYGGKKPAAVRAGVAAGRARPGADRAAPARPLPLQPYAFAGADLARGEHDGSDVHHRVEHPGRIDGRRRGGGQRAQHRAAVGGAVLRRQQLRAEVRLGRRGVRLGPAARPRSASRAMPSREGSTLPSSASSAWCTCR